MLIEMTRSSEFIKVPAHATKDAAAVDLTACHTLTILQGETTMVDTGIAVSIPPGYFLDLRQRSGLSIEFPNYLTNCAGVIDSDYRGTIKAIIKNNSNHPWHIIRGDRVVQAVLVPCMRIVFTVVRTLDQTDRGQDGFGSTGVA